MIVVGEGDDALVCIFLCFLRSKIMFAMVLIKGASGK